MTRAAAVPVALVTGASRGIGAATALALAHAGLNLVLTSTRRGGTARVAHKARALGRVVRELVYDAARSKDADAVVRSAGRVDVLVNNAGIVVRKPLARMADRDFDRVLDVNLRGPFYLTRRLLPAMVRRGQGRVLFVSSISATLGSPGLTGYCASKWGLDGLMKAAAEEARGTGVFVASVLPGSVDTQMLEGSGFAPRMTADEVARVLAWLALDAPAALHGARVEMFG